MSNPITWRSIQAPNFSDALRAEQIAAQSANQGFGNLRDVVRNLEAVNTDNWNTQKANNTFDFLTQARQKFNTPEAYKAAEASGELNRMGTQYGAQVNQDVVSNFLANQLTNLQGKAKQTIDYNNAVQNEADAPIRDQYLNAIYSGDKATIAKLKADNPKARLGDLGRTAMDFEHTVNNDKYISEKRQREASIAPLEEARLKAQTYAAKVSADADMIRARDSRALNALNLKAAQMKLAEQAKALKSGEAGYNEFMNNSIYSMGSMGTKDGKDYFEKELRQRKKDGLISQNQMEDILYNASEYWNKGLRVAGKDGKDTYIPLPVKAVLDAVDSSSDNPLAIGFSRRGDNANNILQAKLGGLDGNSLLTGQEFDQETYDEMIKGARLIHNRMQGIDPEVVGRANKANNGNLSKDDVNNLRLLLRK